MNLTEVQISEIKNLNLIYIFTTDHILRNKTEKYVGAKVVFGDYRTLSLDYKSPYFEMFSKRIIERYNKEKDRRNIILLGPLTEKIVNDEFFRNLGSIEEKKTEGLSLFNTKNHELRKYESYLKDTLKHILKTTLSYEVIDIDKIDGYNNKFVVFYHVGSVELQCNLILSFRDETHLDFILTSVDRKNLRINGTIENDIDKVNVTWESVLLDLYGSTTYDAITNETTRSIASSVETIFHNESTETLLESDLELIKFYLNLFEIPVSQNIIKTDDYNYILGEEEILNHEQTELFFKRIGTQISISDNQVIIRHKIHNGLNKYNNQINVTLDRTIHEITLSKILVDKEEYVLIEHKNKNEFGSVYEYKVYKVDNLDFKNIFVPTTTLNVEENITSFNDVLRYVKKRVEGGNK